MVKEKIICCTCVTTIAYFLHNWWKQYFLLVGKNLWPMSLFSQFWAVDKDLFQKIEANIQTLSVHTKLADDTLVKRSKGVNHLFLLDSIVTFNRNVTRWLDGKIMTFTNRPKTNTSMQCSCSIIMMASGRPPKAARKGKNSTMIPKSF